MIPIQTSAYYKSHKLDETTLPLAKTGNFPLCEPLGWKLVKMVVIYRGQNVRLYKKLNRLNYHLKPSSLIELATYYPGFLSSYRRNYFQNCSHRNQLV